MTDEAANKPIPARGRGQMPLRERSHSREGIPPRKRPPLQGEALFLLRQARTPSQGLSS